jgi:hypothetical protein
MAAAKPKILSSERVVNNIEQYILTNKIEEIAKLHEQLERDRNDFKYYCFRQIDGNGTRIINRLRGIDDLSVFYGIKTSTLSSLQPKIRMFKVNHEDYKLDGAGHIDHGSIKPLPVPCYREFKFSDNFGIETAASVQDYLKYESTKPNFHNVGLESFMVTQNGENHGAIENNLECKLVLSFKSLKDLNASPPGEPTLRYVDLMLWPPARFTKDSEKANPKHYEIKVVLGYTAPSVQQIRALNLSPREEKALKNIEKLDQIISLGLYDYQINIQENGSVKLTASYRGRLETIMGTNQVNIFQDTIRIGTSGNYQLATSGNAEYNMSTFYDTAANLKAIAKGIKSSNCNSSDCQEKKNLEALVQKDAFFATMLNSTLEASEPKTKPQTLGLKKDGKTFEVNDREKLFVWFKMSSNVESMMSTIKEKVGFFRGQLVRTFMDQLIDGNRAPGTTETTHLTRIFVASVANDATLTAITEEPVSPGRGSAGMSDAGEGIVAAPISSIPAATRDELNSKTASLTTAIASNKLDFKFERCKSGSSDTISAKQLSDSLTEQLSPDAQAGAAASPADKEALENLEPEELKYSAPAWLIDEEFTNMRFYYVYLGDIVELACKNARVSALKFSDHDTYHGEESDQNGKSYNIFHEKGYYKPDQLAATANYPLNNARVLLGPLEFIDDDGQPKTINLARMPISLNVFKSWFIDKIIKKRRVQMPLGTFLITLLNDLVIPSLGAGMPLSRKAAGTKASVVSITLPGEIDSNAPKVRGCDGGDIPRHKESLPLERKINTESPEFLNGYYKKAVQPRSTISAVKSSFDYMLFYVTSHKDIIERRGDPSVDIEDGIYHFNIGSDTGILKSMDFSRVSIPHMAALRSEQAMAQGVDQLEQLKFPYNTNVNLVGSALFVPGMFYYVNPSLAGLGSVENAASLAYQMNLGGYHLVQQVSTNISAGKFVTQVVGVQTAQGRK